MRILIADDHQLLLDGLQSLLRGIRSVQVVGMATNGYEVADLLDTTAFDICLLDISMPGVDGIATARMIKERKPEVKVIMLTTYNDKEIVEELLSLGVSGYMLKNCTRSQLLDAFEKVSAGGLYFSPEVEEVILQGPHRHPGPHENEVVVTQRERQVLELLSREYTNERIAAALNISYRTVETHRKNLMHKTKSHNLAGLLKYAYSHKLLNAEDV